MSKSIQGLCLRICVDAVPMVFHSPYLLLKPFTFKTGSRIQGLGLVFQFSLEFYWTILLIFPSFEFPNMKSMDICENVAINNSRGWDFIQKFQRDFACGRCRGLNTVQNHGECVYHISDQVTNNLLENQMHARDQLCRSGYWDRSSLEFRFQILGFIVSSLYTYLANDCVHGTFDMMAIHKLVNKTAITTLHSWHFLLAFNIFYVF